MTGIGEDQQRDFEDEHVTFAAASEKLRYLGRVMALLVVVGILANCASTPTPEDYADENYNANDPYEDINRVTFAINQTIDGVLLKPLAEFYVGIVPQWGRDRVNDVLNNLGEPVNFANAMLQWELERAVTSMLRFAFNSTFGLAGFFDIAEGIGLSRADEDFGQTLAVWGVGEGPYLVLPLFGPSNPTRRGGIGRGLAHGSVYRRFCAAMRGYSVLSPAALISAPVILTTWRLWKRPRLISIRLCVSSTVSIGRTKSVTASCRRPCRSPASRRKNFRMRNSIRRRRTAR